MDSSAPLLPCRTRAAPMGMLTRLPCPLFLAATVPGGGDLPEQLHLRWGQQVRRFSARGVQGARVEGFCVVPGLLHSILCMHSLVYG